SRSCRRIRLPSPMRLPRTPQSDRRLPSQATLPSVSLSNPAPFRLCLGEASGHKVSGPTASVAGDGGGWGRLPAFGLFAPCGADVFLREPFRHGFAHRAEIPEDADAGLFGHDCPSERGIAVGGQVFVLILAELQAHADLLEVFASDRIGIDVDRNLF